MRIKKMIATCLAISTIVTTPVYAETVNNEKAEVNNIVQVPLNEENESENVQKEENKDNLSIISGWSNIGGKTYYYDLKGKKVTGFQKIDSATFYFNEKGEMQTGWKEISKKKYYFNDKGVMQTGWKKISKKQYYFNTKGVMQTGFKKISKKKYYFSKKGVMQTGWKTISKKKYYFNKKGVMQTGFKKIGKNRYYFLKDGVMADCGIYKNYLIAYNGKCYKIPDKKTGNETADAKRVAKLIAKCSGAGKKSMKDLERVGRAAYAVSSFCARCKYTMSGPYYSKAYGVFIAKEYSCAGATRALGLVLTCMGYKWTHVNENQYSHQWIELKMDKKKGFADGMGGFAGYGKYPIAN